jgi:hypothetical protein
MQHLSLFLIVLKEGEEIGAAHLEWDLKRRPDMGNGGLGEMNCNHLFNSNLVLEKGSLFTS